MRFGFLALLTAGPLFAQGAAKPLPAPAERAPLADNSFLIEEAYNQEKGVVQHISVFTRQRGGDVWNFTFTQEWPVGGPRHQLSYSVSEARVGPGTTGFGDMMLNYRFQALADEEGGRYFAPRFSVSLPTGNAAKGLGNGVVGYQIEAPLSLAITKTLVAHSNAGYALFPGGGDHDALGTLNLGQSLVWLALPRFNVLFEAAWTGTTRSPRLGPHAWESTLTLNPGFRWGYDFASGLQIVPGISFPIGVGPSRGAQQVLLYLSFEHPFARDR